MRYASLLAALILATTAVSAAQAAAPFEYHGFRFDTAAIKGNPDEPALLAGARQQVDIVESVGLTPGTMAFLRGHVVHLSPGPGGGHFSREGVAITLASRPDDRPILLHEMMHAFQSGRLEGGMGNPAMRRFFERARSGGMWPAGSYMLSNEAEFFAMTTSVELYGHAARPPFTRAALEEKQPEYAAWIKANVGDGEADGGGLSHGREEALAHDKSVEDQSDSGRYCNHGPLPDVYQFMIQGFSPLRFDPSFEVVPPDEDATQRGLTDAMLSIQRRTLEDEGHAYRAVHAKAHGYLKAKFEVLPGLPAILAQGLFAKVATYDAILRFSTTPGDILHDNISVPRGAALKVLGVSGARLPGSEGDETQNYVLGNSPSFQVATAKGFLEQLRPLAATTGHAEPVKHVISVLSRNANAALELVGQKSATLTTLAGQATTQLLGESFYSQGPLLHGAYFGKVAIVPVSSELTALSGKPLDLAGHPDAIRESIEAYFRSRSAVWELRVQLATDIDKMPVEDAATDWPESDSPYQSVARITADSQETWSQVLQDAIEERLAFSPWVGLAAHRPLGSIMRARRPAYAAARDYRAEANGVTIGEPDALPGGALREHA